MAAQARMKRTENTPTMKERMELIRKHHHFLKWKQIIIFLQQHYPHLSRRHALSSGDLVSSDSVMTVLTIILTVSATRHKWAKVLCGFLFLLFLKILIVLVKYKSPLNASAKPIYNLFGCYFLKHFFHCMQTYISSPTFHGQVYTKCFIWSFLLSVLPASKFVSSLPVVMFLRPAWSGHWLQPRPPEPELHPRIERSRSRGQREEGGNTDVKYQPRLEARATAPASNWQHGKTFETADMSMKCICLHICMNTT